MEYSISRTGPTAREEENTKRRPSILALLVVVPALLLSGTPATGVSSPQYDRVYLLSSDSDYLYWSPDRFDPELGLSTTSRPCGLNYFVPGRAKPCLVGINAAEGTRTYNLFFFPAAGLDEKITWSSTAPLRFHIEADITTGGVPFTVQLVVQKTVALVVSEAATQTAPGVWEGQLTSGSPVLPGDVSLFGLRITSQAPAALVDMRLGGRSYVELPRAFAMHGVGDMIREDVYSPQPTSYTSATRSFAFNDDRWAVRSFSGDTTAPKTFDFTIDQKAEVLLAWTELYDSTAIQDVKHLRQPDPRKPAQGVGMVLSRAGEDIDHTGGAAGIGTTSVAAADLPAGPLSIVVDPAQDGDQSLPYTVHVLEIRGDRTLRTMRWLFMNGVSTRSPAAAVCPRSDERVPVTDKVKTIALDLDWNTEAPGNTGWTFRFDMPYGGYPCSEGGVGDELRLTLPPAERILAIGATPSYGSTFVSAHDTTFEATARYTYSPPAA